MPDTVVCSFYVYRPDDFPEAANYPAMLRLLDRSCRRFGMRHVVLTDTASAAYLRSIEEADDVDRFLECWTSDLPRNLLQAASRAQSNWISSPDAVGVNTCLVGADCLVIRDFRAELEAKAIDIAVVYFNHKFLWILTGLIYVPAHSQMNVRDLFRQVADDTAPLAAETCDDMRAWQRALHPPPMKRYGAVRRRGLRVQFLPEHLWNGWPKNAEEPFPDSFVLHFRGHKQKGIMLEWADRHGFGVDR